MPSILRTLLLPFFAMVFSFVSLAAFGQTITTDKLDYQPGDTVKVTGSGFEPGETVKLEFDETPQVCTSDHYRSTTADASGNIFYNQFYINIKHLGVAFILTATGETSGLTAQTKFTDGAVVVTAASGGGSISADNFGGTWTTLTGPILAESQTGDISINTGNTSSTIILNAPSGFIFNTSAIVSVKVTGNSDASKNINGTLNNQSFAASVTNSTITITITSKSTGNTPNTLTFQNIQIRPSSGSPIASGNITKAGTSSFSTIQSGASVVTTNPNYGTLTMIPGALEHFNIGNISNQNSGVPFDISITAKDQFDNTVTSFTGTTTISSSYSGITPSTSGSFSAGVRTESVTISGYGVNGIITVANNTKTGISNSFDVISSCAAPIINITPLPNGGQPVNQSIEYGQNATFSVDASGVETYKWEVNLNDGQGWKEITTVLFSGYSGFNSASLTITRPPVSMNGYKYRVVLSACNPAESTTSNGSSTLFVSPLGISGTFASANKPYDGNTNAASSDRQVVGAVSGDDVSLTGGTASFATKTAETGKTVTLSGATLAGDDAANYTLSSVATTTADIIPFNLIIQATGVNKIYDGNLTATVNLSSNKITNDVVSLNYQTALFVDANVANAITVNVDGISISGSDAGNYNLTNTTTSTTANITIAPTTTTLTLSAGQIRFMDNLTMTAVIKPTNSTNNFQGNTITGKVVFTINGVDYSNGGVNVVPVPGATDGSVKATLIKQVAEQPNLNASTYPVTAIFTSTNSNYNGTTNTEANNSKDLKVLQRNASPQYVNAGFYTGEVFVWTTSSSSSKATATLIASLKDNEVPNGDLRAAKVTFYYVSNGLITTPIPGAKDLPVGLVDVNDGSVGFATAIVQFDIGSNNAQDFRVAVKVTGAYKNDPNLPSSQALITVAKPVPGGYIVGGSQIENQLSSGYIKGHTGLNTEYQFDIQFTKSGSNPKGKAKVIVQSYYKKDGTLDTKPHTYVITSNAIASLNVVKGNTNGTSYATGTFSAKANLDEYVIIENSDGSTTTTIVPIEGGATFQMEAFQNQCDQQVAITLFRKAGGIWFSSRWENGKTTRQRVNSNSKVFVEGGGTTSCTTATRTATVQQISARVPQVDVAPTATFNLTAFPNPSANHFNVKLESSIANEKITVRVVDLQGRTVELRHNLVAGQTLQLGSNYRPGVYFVEMIQGNNRKQLQLVKRIH